MLSYRKKIFIDRSIGLFTAVLMKGLTRLAGLVLRRNHAIPDNPKVIAVAKIVGLGSIVYTGILCRALKERFPKAKLVYITGYGSFEFVKRMNCIDEVLLINDKTLISMIKSAIFLVLKLWRYHPVLYFDMEVYSSWAAIIATLSLALNRYGFYRKNADFKKGMHTHMIFFNTKRHISEVYGQMALCVKSKSNSNLASILNISNEDRDSCSQILEGIGIYNCPIILINVNSSDLLIERRWPAEKWIDYLEQAVGYFSDFTFLLIGAQNEVKYVSSIYNNLSQKAQEKVLNGAGKFPLGPFLALIEKSVLMVTNDSGPLHLAVALEKPTVSIWGPGAPDHYAPMNGIHKVIYESVYCSPCLYHADYPPCEGNNICVRNIPVSSVFEATKEIFELIKDNNLKKKTFSPMFSLKDDGMDSSLAEVKEFNPVITHKKQRLQMKL